MISERLQIYCKRKAIVKALRFYNGFSFSLYIRLKTTTSDPLFEGGGFIADEDGGSEKAVAKATALVVILFFLRLTVRSSYKSFFD